MKDLVLPELPSGMRWKIKKDRTEHYAFYDYDGLVVLLQARVVGLFWKTKNRGYVRSASGDRVDMTRAQRIVAAARGALATWEEAEKVRIEKESYIGVFKQSEV